MSEKDKMLKVMSGEPKCPHCGRHLETLIMRTMEYVYYKVYVYENHVDFDVNDREDTDEDVIFYCPYCDEVLPIHNILDAQKFLMNEDDD